MAFDTTPADTAQAKAHTTLLRLALPAYTVHFKSPTYLQIHTLDLIDNKCTKPILKESAGNTALSAQLRERLAQDDGYWSEMVELVAAGVKGLERRSLSSSAAEADVDTHLPATSSSSALIISNYPTLWRDLNRLNDLLSISRNVLTVGEVAQKMAVAYTLEFQIFKLINVCVRVTARGYDGDTAGDASKAHESGGQGTGGAGGMQEEEKWQWVISAYKKLLITCLQWLNNFVAGNERGKVLLWAELFDSATDSLGLDEEEEGTHAEDGEMGQQQPQQPSKELATKSKEIAKKEKKNEVAKKPSPPITNHDILLAYGTNGSSRISPLEMEGAIPLYNPPPPPKPNSTSPPPPINREGFKPLPTQIQALAKKNHYDANGYVYFTARHKGRAVEIYQEKHGRSPTLAEIHLAMPVLWEEERQQKGRGGKGQWVEWQGGYDRAVREYSETMERFEKGLIEGIGDGRVDTKMVDRLVAGKDVEVEGMQGTKNGKEQRDSNQSWRSSQRTWQRPKKVDVAAKVAALEAKLRMEYERGEWVGGNHTLGQDRSIPLALNFNALQGLEVGNASTSTKTKDNTELLFDAAAGLKILESGKAELMKRLEGFAAEDESPLTNQNEGMNGARSDIRRRRRKERRDLDLADALGEMGGEVREVRRKDSERAQEGADKAAADERLRAEVLGPRTSNAGTNGIENHDTEGSDASAHSDHEASDSNDDEDDDESDDEEEEDYPGSSEDGRGLLTDVPLILGPSEIEVLPMLVMSGIYPSLIKSTTHPTTAVSQAPLSTRQETTRPDLSPLTLHLLLTRTPGLNLLRELLIFVAAWDLREEELYFKFMLKIVEKIWEVGMLPFLYWSLRDRSRSRDVISPAQAVVLKLCTGLLRGRRKDSSSSPTTALTAVDLHWLNFLFSEFRQHIIPQTCALIFLQGQIWRGKARREDFPLNLWDMERMYEGVYGVLEFWGGAVEEKAGNRGGEGAKGGPGGAGEGGEGDMTWKGMLSKWEMASELITLLRELESGIPKMGAPAPIAATSAPVKKATSDLRPTQQQRSLSADDIVTLPPPPTVSNTSASFDGDTGLPPPPASSSSAQQRIFEAETPLAYPEEQQQSQQSQQKPTAAGMPTLPPIPSAPTLHEQFQDTDEPSLFSWQNLRKLTVLVLSSLVHRNPLVQRQVREFGGLEVLVACCGGTGSLGGPGREGMHSGSEGGSRLASLASAGSIDDENNPYLREHAVMALRFAVEEAGGSEGREEARSNMRYLASMGGGSVETVGGLGRAGRKPRYDGSVDARGEDVNDAMAVNAGLAGRDRGGADVDVNINDIVPAELLDQGKYETFLDPKGHVGLRRKSDNANANLGLNLAADGQDRAATASAPPTSLFSSTSSVSSTAAKMTAQKAAELMQNALRDLPLGTGEKLVTDQLLTERQRAEALRRLDLAFERGERDLEEDEK